jgi:hypothetical protein
MAALKPNPNQELEKLLLAAKQARLPYDRDAWLNIAFYLNQQYSEWNEDIANIQLIPRRDARDQTPRPIINKIMHFVRQAHHDALQDEPSPDVLPPTSDYQDISDSLVAKAWCDYQAGETVTDYISKLGRSALWSILAGNGYKKWSWNGQSKALQIGAPGFFEIYLDPYAKEWSEVRHIIHSQFMDVEQVYETYGIEVKPDAVETADKFKTDLLRGMGCAPVVQGVTVHELWMKPCRRHPEGLFAVWTGRTQLVAPTKLPYPHLIKHRMLPFTFVGCIERPDSAYYMSPVTYLRPAQMELNKAHAQMMVGREAFTNFKWFLPTGLDLDVDPDASPAQILRAAASSDPTLRPEIIQAAAMPVTQDLDVIEQGMMHIVGQHEVSQAQVPGRVEAAKAIELLKESDAGAQATMRKTIRAANSQGWYQALELAREFGTEEDMVFAYSRDGVNEVKHFRAKDMKPGFRVRTTMTTGLARSRTARQDLAMRLWEQKVITDPNQLLELMEVPTGNVLQYQAVSIRLARNENLTMAANEAVVANSWDDHALHIREHNAYRQTHEFEALDPEAKEKFEFHVTMHKKLQMAFVAEQAQLQMIAQGQPGAPAGPVPPGTVPPNTPQEEVQ